MVDTVGILIAYLTKADTPLKTLTGNNVFVGRLPEEFINTSPAIMLTTRGGLSKKEAPLYKPSFQFKIYGGTNYILDAKNVYGTVRDYLHAANSETFQSGILNTAYEEQPGQELFEPDTSPNWPYVLAFFTILFKPNS